MQHCKCINTFWQGYAKEQLFQYFSIFALIKTILFVYLKLNERLIIISSPFEREKNINSGLAYWIIVCYLFLPKYPSGCQRNIKNRLTGANSKCTQYNNYYRNPITTLQYKIRMSDLQLYLNETIPEIECFYVFHERNGFRLSMQTKKEKTNSKCNQEAHL